MKTTKQMKTIARVKFCDGFIKALQSPEFPNLRMYCSEWTHKIESDGTMICEVVDDTDIKTGQPKKSLDIELALFDYFFNVSCEEEVRERRNLWAMVNNKIDRQIIKVINI